MTQTSTLWQEVGEIKRAMITLVGPNHELDFEYRSTPGYQSYCACLGEAVEAKNDKALSPEIVTILRQQARRAIGAYYDMKDR